MKHGMGECSGDSESLWGLAGRGAHDKHAPGLFTDSSAVICIRRATCCRSDSGYPARIPGMPIPNGKLGFLVLVGSFLMRFRSGPCFSV